MAGSREAQIIILLSPMVSRGAQSLGPDAIVQGGALFEPLGAQVAIKISSMGHSMGIDFQNVRTWFDVCRKRTSLERYSGQVLEDHTRSQRGVLSDWAKAWPCILPIDLPVAPSSPQCAP